MTIDLSRDKHSWHRIEITAADGGQKISRARTTGGQSNSRDACNTRETLGGKSRGLLVVHANNLDAFLPM